MIFFGYALYLLLAVLKFMLFSYFTNTAFPLEFLLMNLAGMLLLSSWTLLIQWKKRRWIWLTLLFLHSLLLISDLWYYRYFEDMLSVSLFSQMLQMSDVGGGFMALIRFQDFFLFADVMIFLLILFFTRTKTFEVTKKKRRTMASTTFLIGVVLFATPLIFSAVKEDQSPNQSVSDMRDYYKLGFWGYHGVDLWRGVMGALDSEKNLTVKQQKKLAENNSENADGSPIKPNIIMIQLESFQGSLIEQKINGKELTPNLNELKEETLYFSSFYHQTHEGRTSDAEFITNTSLYPLKSGSVYTRFPENEFGSLPELLKENGYDTAAMHAYDKGFWNRDKVYENIGFNHFFSNKDYPNQKKIGMALNDKNFLTTSIEHMETLKEPYFAFMVALTSHTPYEIPEEERDLDLSGYDDPMLKRYYQTVYYVDQAVGLMVDELKQKGMWEDSLVIFYGDHDSGLTNEGSEMRKEANVESAVDAFELDRQVPLFIKKPNEGSGQVIKENGGQIDIAPTIADMLNMEMPYMMGNSLLDDQPNLTAFRDGSFRYRNYYYEADLTEDAGNGTCYDVSTEEKVSLDKCDDQIEKVPEQLRLSDAIIEKNGLEEENE
ncbi:LTA synthase family protein [Guptibacillus hwajinpoensis]|uniref:LTA synthase family protein n=1 Tax=Guptibacillus hwajinpoensis TaxID=208199 RepID=UPI0018847032|nr:LTA synthase family protein [Pseudalkalibacillus hwajinpoensis]MBF0707465.1 LTA synthase family protein [Pseudalkalibacillus hwajinpoensis]WLR58877.1 LTA synthase family protein [Pseudalkalibacillus hwajinpoensis]